MPGIGLRRSISTGFAPPQATAEGEKAGLFARRLRRTMEPFIGNRFRLRLEKRIGAREYANQAGSGQVALHRSIRRYISDTDTFKKCDSRELPRGSRRDGALSNARPSCELVRFPDNLFPFTRRARMRSTRRLRAPESERPRRARPVHARYAETKAGGFFGPCRCRPRGSSSARARFGA